MIFSKELSAILLEQTNDIILYTDLQGQIEYVNDQFVKTTLFKKEEAQGKSASILKSGKQKKAFFTKIWNDLSEGIPVQTTFINQRKNGNFYYQGTKIFPVSDGKLQQGFLSIGEDLTENIRKIILIDTLTHEVESLSQDFSTFLYKASHNLRAPVANILGLLDIVKLEINDSKILSYFNMMVQTTEKLDHILYDLIKVTVIRSTTLCRQSIDFTVLVDDVLRNLNKLYPINKFIIHKNIKVPATFKFEKIVLRNLIRPVLENAFQYRKYEPVNKNYVPDAPHQVSISITEENGFIIIQIKDNGIGISESHLKNIFDMFFKSSEKSEGAGLGLFIARSAVQRLNGITEISSQIDEGTTVTFKIPDAGYSD